MGAINARVLDDLRALQIPGAPSFLDELIGIFLRETALHVQKMRDALAARDALPFERSAHMLKGSCGNLGAQAMSRICADLQQSGQAIDWTRAAAAFSALEKEWTAVKAELEAELGKPA